MGKGDMNVMFVPNKRFFQAQHKKTHIGEKLYECGIYHQAFVVTGSIQSTLSNHKKMHKMSRDILVNSA